MEKKGSRSVQPASKGLTTDSKKHQDAWPRGGRRRESNNGSLSAKNDPSRKPNPQRTKAVDKRPRQRGLYNPAVSTSGTSLARGETPCLTEQDIELGSVFLPGSKKQSLNHLLNFVYSSHVRETTHSPRTDNNHGNRMQTKKHKYNKEQFLQANCQFIVNAIGDYKQYLNNPDALVDWNLVEQVNVQVYEAPSCPICLYPPVAAKMTRCGHIYCWSCILHYLSLSDKSWRKCPICYESVHKNDLKSVVSIPHHTFNLNEVVTFKLMKRQKGSLIAYPADADIDFENKLYNISEKQSSEMHSKLLLAKIEDIMSIIDREKHELDNQLKEENCSETCFIEEAMVLLKERENIVLSNVGNNKQDHAVVENIEIENDVNSNNKYHYFYQASDGQHLYLHAINARMIEHSYGSLEFGPKTLSGRILEKEGGSMTEDLRKRLRYLQHMPLTCQFEVAEIHLRPPVVQKDTLKHFQDQIDIRRNRRSKRARDEKRREKRIIEEENRQMGKFPEVNVHLESHEQFPDFGSERQRTESETAQSEEGSTESFSLPSSLSLENEYSGPSFATMLSTTKKPKSNWPGLKTSNAGPSSSSSEPLKLINVTGSRVYSSIKVRSHDSDGEIEDLASIAPVPEPNRSFGDVIAQALQKASQQDLDKENGQASLGGKKKKKNKPKVLFATSMAYSGN